VLGNRNLPPLSCIVSRDSVAPAKDGEFQYRIRRQGAAEDVVVGESELRVTKD
jgi:hypothetical protein